MPLFMPDDDFRLISGDSSAVAERADSFIRDLRAAFVAIQSMYYSEVGKLKEENGRLLESSHHYSTQYYDLHLESINKDGHMESLKELNADLVKERTELMESIKNKDLEIQSHIDKDAESIVSNLLTSLPRTFGSMEPEEIHTLYESVGYLIRAESEDMKKYHLSKLMEIPNERWVEIFARAKQSRDSLRSEDVLFSLIDIIKINARVVSSLGNSFFSQMSRKSPEMHTMYKWCSELIASTIAKESSFVEPLRCLKREILKLFEKFLEKAEDNVGRVVVHDVIEVVLTDVHTDLSFLETEPVVLSLFTRIIDKFQGHVLEEKPRSNFLQYQSFQKLIESVISRHTSAHRQETSITIGSSTTVMRERSASWWRIWRNHDPKEFSEFSSAVLSLGLTILLAVVLGKSYLRSEHYRLSSCLEISLCCILTCGLLAGLELFLGPLNAPLGLRSVVHYLVGLLLLVCFLMAYYVAFGEYLFGDDYIDMIVAS